MLDTFASTQKLITLEDMKKSTTSREFYSSPECEPIAFLPNCSVLENSPDAFELDDIQEDTHEINFFGL